MVRCGAIKPTGERCKAKAIEGSEWCWNYNPAHEEDRRRHGSKGGKRGGRGHPEAELHAIKNRLSDLADGVLAESVDRQNAAVVGQLLNTVLRAISVELKVREQLDLIERIEVFGERGAALRRSRANVGVDARLRRFVGAHGEREQPNGLRSAL